MNTELEFEYIETDRYKLRIVTAEKYKAYLDSTDVEMIADFTGKSLEEAQLEKNKAQYGFRTHNKTFIMFMIIDKQNQKVIGDCGFHTWYLDHNRAEIGYALFNDQSKGKGVMTEVLKRVIEYGFDTLGLLRIEAFISPENIASLKTVAKYGFTKEGQMRHHYLKNGNYDDSVIYSLLKQEYRK